MRWRCPASLGVALASAFANPAAAEPLPPGSLGLVFGVVGGTQADAARIGFGYFAPLYPPSFSAAWQPMTTEQRVGWAAEASFLQGLATFNVVSPAPEDWERIAELVRQYSDFPLGGTDASIMALAERE